MKKTEMFLIAIVSMIVSLSLFSCDKSVVTPTPIEKGKEYKMVVIVDDGNGNITTEVGSTTPLRAGVPKRVGDAEISGLRNYYHNESCSLGVRAVSGVNKKVKHVIFKYDSGSYSGSVLPTTVLEYKNRVAKPANGYEDTFNFSVVANVVMHVTLETKASGINIGME